MTKTSPTASATLLADRSVVREQKMFGGLAFMVDGNMACGILRGELIIRVGKENLGDALCLPHARIFNMTGRPMRSFVYVAAEGIATDEGLQEWASRGIDYAGSLPPK